MALEIGPFSLQEVLGRGGSAVVYRARHRSEPVDAALKILNSPGGDDLDRAGRFHREIRAVAALDHPSIAMILDYGNVPPEVEAATGGALAAGSPWLAMELAEGTLSTQRGALSWGEVREILVRLLSALACAHARGVVHRDVKPSNLLVGGLRSPLVLTDFGIARIDAPGSGERSDGGVLHGTLGYMAPEQCEGSSRDQGPWTDLYAVGCTAWALLCGSPPFGSGLGALTGHLGRPPPPFAPVRPVPGGVEGWLRALLEKDPARRIRHAADAADALEAIETPARIRPRRRWSDGEPHPHSPVQLVSAGLRLFGLRERSMVGREAERDLLWSALDEVVQTGGIAMVLVEGSTGCGKSQLARWLSERAGELGVANTMRALHGPVPGPRSGLVAMVSAGLGCEGLPPAAVRARIAAVLARAPELPLGEAEALAALVAPDDDSGVRFGHAEERYVLIERFLRRASRERPVLLWLDDIHHGADAIAFAGRLLGEACEPMPVLIVATAATDVLAEQPPVRAALDALAQGPRVRRLELPPLGGAAATALVRSMLPFDPITATILEDRTAGNPMFAVQLATDWVQRGLLALGPAGFRLPPDAHTPLPDDLAGVWSARVDRLLLGAPPGAEGALERVAALGPHVDPADWGAACEDSALADDGWLMDALTTAGLARADRRSGLSLVHGMLRESILHRAARAGRLEAVHLACAAIVERRGGSDARLAEHLLAAGQLERALAPLEDAIWFEYYNGGNALVGHQLYETYLSTLDRLGATADDARRMKADLMLGRILYRLGSVAGSRDATLRAASNARAIGARDLLQNALRECGKWQRILKDVDAAHRSLSEAIEVARERGDASGLAACRCERASLLAESSRIEDRQEAERTLRELLAGPEIGPNISSAMHELSRVLFADGRLEECAEMAERALRIYEARGAREGAAQMVNILGEVARARGERDRAEALYADSLARYQAIDSIDGAVVRMNLAFVHVEQGRTGEARGDLLALLDIFARQGRRGFDPHIHAGLLACSADGDDADWARHMGVLRASEVHAVDVAALASLAGEIAARAGRPERAREALALAAAQWRGLGRKDEAARLEA